MLVLHELLEPQVLFQIPGWSEQGHWELVKKRTLRGKERSLVSDEGKESNTHTC